MKTLTATRARQNLGAYLERALDGEDIGIIWGDQVVALRPVRVVSEDSALIEYRMTEPEMDRAVKQLNKTAKADEQAGKIRRWDGTARGLRG